LEEISDLDLIREREKLRKIPPTQLIEYISQCVEIIICMKQEEDDSTTAAV
jgi:hypothetical protein